MNHVYRLVFNRALGLIQVAPETARARAGTAAQAGRIGRRSAVGIAPLSLLALGLMMAASTVRADYCGWYGTWDGDWFNPSNWHCYESGHSRVPTSDDDVRVDGHVTIDGDAAKSSSFLLVSGQLTIRNGGTLQSDTFHSIGWHIHPATLTVTGSGSAWNVTGGDILVGRNSSSTLVLREGGALNAGNSTLALGASVADNATPGLGTLVIGAAAGEQAVAPGTIEVAAIEMGRQNGTAEAAGRIVFNHTDTSGDYTFATDITGTGAIEHYAGTTVLSGTNTYTGGTHLLGGTLSVASDAALGAGAGALHFDGGMLQVTGRDFDATTRAITLGDGGGGFDIADASHRFTLAQDITGSGALVKHGAGTLVLTGSNDHAGGTRLFGGTLSVSSDSALGAPSSALHFDGGTLQVTGTEFGATTRAITLGEGGGGFDIADASHRFTLAQDITGDGALVKHGAGTLVLTGSNDHAGGTRIEGGRLVGHAGSFGSGGIEIGTGAFLRLDQATDAILSSQVSGTGHMIKEGAGTLALDGGEHRLDNLYLGRYESVGTWAPVDDGGTLQLRDGATLQATGGLYMNRVRTRVTLELLGEGTSATFGASALIGDTGSEARVVIRDGARLENGIAVVGNRNDSQGFVTVTGEASLWRSNEFLHVGGNGQSGSGSLRVEHGGRVESGIVRLGYGSGATGDAVVTGAGSRWDTRGEIRLGEAGNGTLLIDDGAVVTSRVGTSLATGHIASYNAPSSRGSATIRNGGAWIHEGGVVVGQYEGSEGSLTLASGGRVQTGTGTGGAAERNMIRLAGHAGSRGTLNIGAAFGETAEAAGILDSERVEFGAGEATLVFNHTDDIAFGAVLLSTDAGTHALHHLAGTTTLAGDSSGFAGATTVAGGTLLVDGAIGGHITVQDGGTLGGSGTVADTRVQAGGTLSAGNSPGTLQVDGDLVLEAGSRAVFELNGPGVAGGTGARGNDLVEVAGDLSLDGQLDARVAAAGHYRLFHYGGALTGAFAGGTVTGTAGFQAASGNPDLRYDVAGQVNLVVLGAGQTMQFWDGGDTAGNGTVDGGDGLWQGFGTNWTDADGTANAGWGGSVGVFAGTAGTVTVQDTQRFDTLQFSTDGYRIEGDALRMAATAGGSFNVDAGVTATVASRIEDGAGSVLRKAGGGTLVLEGDNAYTGGTHLLGGTLSVASDAALGAGAGALHFDGGMLQVTGRVFDATTRAITLGDGGGGFDIADAGHRFTLAQDITGSGALVKDGAGTLVLEGDNAYTGGTRVLAGTLVGSAGAIAGDLHNGGTVVFEQEDDAVFAGAIAGLGGTGGGMVKRGAGLLELAGHSTLDWTVEAGTLAASAQRFTGDLAIAGGAGFRFDQEADGTYAGTLSGDGALRKQGAGGLTLAGDSSGFTGTTTVSAGTLRVDGLLGGRVTVQDGATLGGAGTVGGDVTVSGGTLSGEQGQTLEIGGDLALDAGSRVAAALGASGASALFRVDGDLFLDGTLDITDAGGFGAGIYRLFDYGGTLGGNGLAFGEMPDGVDPGRLLLQTAVAGQVNLVSAVGARLVFWDGGDPARHDNGAVDGGSGRWQAGGRNWTDANGIVNGPLSPVPAFAVFQGEAGVVTVDAPVAGMPLAGLQFATDGYRVEGDALRLEGIDGRSVVRVGDGGSDGAGFTAFLSSALHGDATLVKTDLGTLVLEGDNAYTGGTRIEGGTLSVSSDSALGATSGDIALAGGALHAAESFDSGRALTLESDGRIATARDATLTLSGSIGGDGVLVKDGAGTLVLTGTNRYRGGTRVEAGALVGHAAGFGDGDIRVDDGASLRFDQHTTASLAAALSGAGDIVKEGEGGLGLTGNSAGFTGTTTVSAGLLRVDGLLGGRVTVQDGATLGGAGTVGDTTVQAGATLAPGNSIGTLRIDGDLVFQAGARYEVEVDPAGTGSDLVEVTGTASLQGGSVVHIGANGGYGLRSTYRILSAGSLQGTFDTVSSDFAFLAPELAYDHQAGTVDLTLVRNDRDFASVASTRNQKATAAGIESIGLEAGHAVHDAIAQMPDDAALIRAGFDALSGEAHASARALLLDDAGWLADAVTRRHAGAAATGELTPATTLWLDAGGGQARTGSDGNGARWQGNAHGLAVGADVEVGPGRIGLAAGKRRTNQQVSDRSSRNRIDSRHLALHAAATLGPVQLAGGVARGRYTLELDRRVALAEIDETLASSSDAEADVLFLEASLAEPARGVTPWLGIRQVRLDSDPARESGGSAALSVAGGRHDLGSATLGVLADRRLGDGSRLQARLGWRHAWGDLTPWATVAFDAGDAFTVYAPAMARNSLVYALDLGLATGPRSRLALGMAGQAGDGSRAWGAQLQWQATF